MRVRRFRLSVLLPAWSALLGICPLPAAAQLMGPEFRVNSYTTGYQFWPAVAADGAGGFVVAWIGSGQDGSGLGIFGQRFDSAGLPAGSEFRVNSFTAGNQRRPAVAADGAGDFVVVWDSPDQDGSGYGVFGQRFDAAGVPAGSEFQVNSYTTGGQAVPAVAADGAGDFVVVWSGANGQDGSGVLGQRFDAAGLPAGGEFLVNSYTTGGQDSPAVAAAGAGGFVVVWHGSGPGGAGVDVFAQRFDPAGLPVGGELLVNTYTTDAQGDPAVAVDGAGNFVVVWDSRGQDGSLGGVFAQRFDSAGAAVGGEFQVNSYTTGYQYWPAVAAAATGDFVVVWRSSGQDGSSQGVFGQRFDAAGGRTGSEFRVNAYTTNIQTDPAVTADGAGNFVATWQSFGQDGSGWGVYARRMTAPLFADGFETGDSSAWSFVCNAGDICP